MDHDLLFTGFDKLCDMKSNYPLNAEGLLTAQSQAAFFTEVSQVYLIFTKIITIIGQPHQAEHQAPEHGL